MMIAGNWKMFKGPAEARAFFDRFEPPQGVDVVLCPPFSSLEAAVDSGATVYAQNVHWEPTGAYTGEVSPGMLLELGVAGALVGHHTGLIDACLPGRPPRYETPAQDHVADAALDQTRQPRPNSLPATRAASPRLAILVSGVQSSTSCAHTKCSARLAGC